MKIIVFGATGRVGKAFVHRALAAGHTVSGFARDTRKLPPGCAAIQGDVTQAGSIDLALQGGFDAVVACLGTGTLKPSTLVTDATTAIVAGMQSHGILRLLAVSGTAEMPDKTWAGKVYTRILRLTPVGHAVRDHDGAYAAVMASNLSWVLVGCNYIADGAAKGRYKTAKAFPGGFKTIRPGDVADFLLTELQSPRHHQKIVGIWY